LGADRSQEMITIIRCRIFCLPVCYPRTKKIKVYRTTISSVVLYGCETWSLTLREERRLRVFENRVLGRAFGPKKYEIAVEWRRLHNRELNALYCSPNIIRLIKSRRMEWGKERFTQVLVGKPEGKRPLGRTGRRWKDSIKMDFSK